MVRETTRQQWAVCAFFFWAALDLAAGGSMGLWELSALWVGGELALWFFREGKCSLKASWRALLRRMNPAGGLLLLLVVLYLALEGGSLLWSPDPALLLPKYPGLLLMGTGGAGAVLFCRGKEGRAALLASLGLAGCVAALLSWLPAAFPQLPAAYRLRLSLRADYNTFAQVVMLGGTAATCERLSREEKASRVLWELAAVWAACIPTVLLSASRRGMLLLWPVLAVLAWAALKSGWKGREILRIAGAAGTGAFGLLMLLRQGLERRHAGFAELSAGQRYAAMADGSFVAKRLAIWREGLTELFSYTPAQWIVGKGGGWNIFLYDQKPMPHLENLYGSWERGSMSAHNFLLADLLDGGLLRLTAGLLMLLALAFCLWTVSRPPWEQAFLLCTLAVSGFSCLISNRYGLWGDRFFWIAGACCAMLPLSGFPKEVADCENPVCNDQCPSPRRCACFPPGSHPPGSGRMAGGDPQPGICRKKGRGMV